jgi:alpha-galactosidase
MAVEAAISGDPRLVYQAIAHDPLTAAVLSLAEIKEMVNCMLDRNRDYLPTFRHFQA